MIGRAAPYVLARGENRSHPGSFPMIKAAAADTGGLLTVAEDVCGPRTAGPPLHIHDVIDECFYVVEGHLAVQAGEHRYDLGPGGFAWVPRQVAHTFANVSGEPVRVVGIYVPAGIEEYFARQGAYFATLQGPPDPGRLAEVWAGHRGRIVGPPIDVPAAPVPSRS